jgi:hypothetical protein
MPRYSYEDLIDAYFRSIKKSFSKFKTSSCRQYVQQYRHKFDDTIFMQRLACFLAEVDDQLSDYSLNSDDGS